MRTRAATRAPARATGRRRWSSAEPPSRPQPPALLHRDLRLRGVRLPLLHGAGARPRRATAALRPDRRRRARHVGAREERTARGRRRPRAARVEPGERVGRRQRGAGRAHAGRPRSRLRAPARRRCWRRFGLARLELLRRADRAGATRAGPRCRCCSGSAAPSCAARSTCWSSGTAGPPLVVDYKTDRLGGDEPGRARRPLRDPARDLRARRRRGARRAEVEVAYVFLERPEEPVVTARPERDGAGREQLEATIAAIGAASSRSPRRATRLGPLPRLPGPGTRL